MEDIGLTRGYYPNSREMRALYERGKDEPHFRFSDRSATSIKQVIIAHFNALNYFALACHLLKFRKRFRG